MTGDGLVNDQSAELNPPLMIDVRRGRETPVDLYQSRKRNAGSNDAFVRRLSRTARTSSGGSTHYSRYERRVGAIPYRRGISTDNNALSVTLSCLSIKTPGQPSCQCFEPLSRTWRIPYLSEKGENENTAAGGPQLYFSHAHRYIGRHTSLTRTSSCNIVEAIHRMLAFAYHKSVLWKWLNQCSGPLDAVYHTRCQKFCF
jgi:hypothetical protein